MMMRRRGPGLIRAAATTAVVAGTATAVSGRVASRQERRAMEQQAAYQQQAAYEPQAMPAEPDYSAELAKLAQLKAQGIITEEEFQAKKKQILGI
jgi:hypothetical protein